MKRSKWVRVFTLVLSLLLGAALAVPADASALFGSENNISVAAKKSTKKKKKKSKKSKKAKETTAEETTEASKKSKKTKETTAEETKASKKKKKSSSNSLEDTIELETVAETKAKKKKKKKAKETTAAKKVKETKATEAPTTTEAAETTETAKETTETAKEITETAKETTAEAAGTTAEQKETTASEEKTTEEKTTEAQTKAEESSEQESSTAAKSMESSTAESSEELGAEAEEHPDVEMFDVEILDYSAESIEVQEVQKPAVTEFLEPVFTKDFRFRHIEPDTAMLRDGTKIYTKKSTESDVVGEAKGAVLVNRIQKDKGWTFVECGYVRGFVETSELITDERMERLEERQKAWEKHHEKGEESPLGAVLEKMDHLKNPAFDYTLTTAMDVAADKEYAVAEGSASIYDSVKAAEKRSTEGLEAKVTGTVKEGTLLYVLAEADKKVVFVESGNVRGFMNVSDLKLGKEAESYVKKRDEKKMARAEEKIKPENNRALYYTVTSVLEPNDAVRQEVVSFALQFIGNPYKWGGTDLIYGIDCSGFTMQVYRRFGYSLPHSSFAQRSCGKAVKTVKDAKPGDLICFDGHVALYIGNGEVVHASNHYKYPRGGIKVSKITSMAKILAVRRIIP